ncbi:MAG: hypothetical protein KF878_24005 [Planctomycetes bacterium]|nr:hypothetical protein [Planctomycetota bacterium]
MRAWTVAAFAVVVSISLTPGCGGQQSRPEGEQQAGEGDASGATGRRSGPRGGHADGDGHDHDQGQGHDHGAAAAPRQAGDGRAPAGPTSQGTPRDATTSVVYYCETPEERALHWSRTRVLKRDGERVQVLHNGQPTWATPDQVRPVRGLDAKTLEVGTEVLATWGGNPDVVYRAYVTEIRGRTLVLVYGDGTEGEAPFAECAAFD